MSRRTRKNARLGRYLNRVAAEPFLEVMPIMGPLVEGMLLVPTTRPYVRRDGCVTVRLVFRGKGHEPDTTVVTWTLRGPLTDKATRALNEAMGPKLRLREDRNDGENGARG